MTNKALISVLACLGPVLALIRFTSPLVLPHAYTEDRGNLGTLQERDLWKRQDQCDQSQFFCPTGTCFTDPANGYIGCCSVSSCAPRTACIEYDSALSQPCDPDTGGCLYCSNKDNPHCMKITNIGANQWIQYCATIASTETLNYANPVTTGSQWSAPLVTAIAQSVPSVTAASSTAQSTSSGNTSSTSLALPSSSAPSTSFTPPATASGLSPVPSTQAPANITSINTISNTSTEVATATSTLSGGAIGGIIVGATLGLVVVGAVIWLLRKRSANRKIPPAICSIPEKHAQVAPTPPSGTKEDPAEVEGSGSRAPSQFFSPSGFSQHHEADSRPVSMTPHPAVRIPTRGLGIRPVDQPMQKRSSRYTISNPDPQSPTTDRSSPFVSPMLSQQGGSSPSTADIRVPETPMTGHGYQQNMQYTPSLYAADPPGSIPHTSNARPPSLPQPYSVAALPGDGPASGNTERRSGLYRGLSSRAGEPNPPWAYLSPENAVNGGWINGHESL